jgi:hypothetical protein
MDNKLIITESEFPRWIHQAKRGIDWGIFLVLLVTLAINWTFIIRTDLPRNNDTESYVFRTEDTANAIREGILYPRWSPHVLFGLGAPIPHYYPPAPVYFSAILRTLFTADSLIAVRIIFLLVACVSGISFYALLLRHTNAKIALISAFVYVSSPYIGMTAPQYLGDLQGLMGLMVLSLWLWALTRFYAQEEIYDGVIVILISAFLFLTDPLETGFVAIWLGIVYTLFMRSQGLSSTLIWRATKMFCIGALLSAFYWLPALLDYQSVLWEQIGTSRIPLLDVTSFFSNFHGLEPLAFIPKIQLTIGTPLFFLVILSGIYSLYNAYQRRFSFQMLLLLCGVGVSLLALSFFRNAYWLVGVATFCFACGCSQFMQIILDWRPKIVRQLLIIMCLFVVITSAPVWSSQYPTDEYFQVDSQEQIRSEQQLYHINTLPMGSWIPTNISLTSPPNGFIVTGYQENTVIRLSSDDLIRNQLILFDETSQSQNYQVTLLSTSTVQLLLNPFPAWQVRLNSQVIPVQVQGDNMAFELESVSQGELVIQFGDTPSIFLGELISVIGIVFTILVVRQNLYQSLPTNISYMRLLNIRDTRLLFVTIVLCIGVSILLNSGITGRTLQTAPGDSLQGITVVNNPTNTPLRLIGYEWSQSNLQVEVTFFWQIDRPTNENFKIRLQLSNVENLQTYLLHDLELIGHYASSRWETNSYVADQYNLTLPDSLPAGRYVVMVDIVSCATRYLNCDETQTTTFFDNNGNSLGRSFTIPRIIEIE